MGHYPKTQKNAKNAKNIEILKKMQKLQKRPGQDGTLSKNRKKNAKNTKNIEILKKNAKIAKTTGALRGTMGYGTLSKNTKKNAKNAKNIRNHQRRKMSKPSGAVLGSIQKHPKTDANQQSCGTMWGDVFFQKNQDKIKQVSLLLL
jgi:hypothetical protein